MTLITLWKENTKEMCAEAKEKRWSIEAFYQDRFYSSGNKYGYPICVRIWPEVGTVAKVEIVGWATYPETCFALIGIVEQLIREEGLQPK